MIKKITSFVFLLIYFVLYASAGLYFGSMYFLLYFGFAIPVGLVLYYRYGSSKLKSIIIFSMLVGIMDVFGSYYDTIMEPRNGTGLSAWAGSVYFSLLIFIPISFTPKYKWGATLSVIILFLTFTITELYFDYENLNYAVFSIFVVLLALTYHTLRRIIV